MLSAKGSIGIFNPFFYTGLITHIFAHSSWGHYFSNMAYLLLVGPAVEKAYGSVKVGCLIIATGAFIAVMNAIFWSHGLVGASGVVFMLIVLNSFADHQPGTISVITLLVLVFFLGKELTEIFSNNQVSQTAHLIGGLVGLMAGYILKQNANSKSTNIAGNTNQVVS